MQSEFVGPNREKAERALARRIAEGRDAYLDSDYERGMNGIPEFMGYRVIYCSHTKGD